MVNSELTTKLRDLAFSKGVCLFGVAAPEKGFDKALHGHKPLDTMPDCRSVIVVGVASARYSESRSWKPMP